MKGNKRDDFGKLLEPLMKKVQENMEKIDEDYDKEIKELRRKYFGANNGWFYTHGWVPGQQHRGFRRLEAQKAIEHLRSLQEHWHAKRDAWVDEQLKEQINTLNDLHVQAAKLQMTIGFVQKSLTSARKELRKVFRKQCPLSVQSRIQRIRKMLS